MEEKFCPCCKNRCPVTALSCGKGKAYFGISAEGEHGRRGFQESGDEVVDLLLKCGHTLHHSHGASEIKLYCLNQEERAQLVALLKKCLKNLER